MEDETLRKGILLLVPFFLIAVFVIFFHDWILSMVLTAWMNIELYKIRRGTILQYLINKRHLD